MQSLDLIALGDAYITELLFVYGELQPSYFPPKGAIIVAKDSIKGDLYNLGRDAALVNINNSNNIAEGYTLLLTRSELLKIDKEELPEFIRVRGTTTKGYNTWVYTYIGDKDLSKYSMVKHWVQPKL